MTLVAAGAPVPTTSLDRVLSALDRGGWKYRRQGRQTMAICPVHAESTPSLSVRYDAVAGKVMLHCFGCGDAFDYRAVCDALGLDRGDLFDAPLPDRGYRSATPRPRRPSLPPRLTRDEVAPTADLSGAKWEPVVEYEYADGDGVVRQKVIRERAVVDGAAVKRFSQRFRAQNGRWRSTKPEGFAPLLYNLAAVRATAARGGDVWLLEGEKDADTAIGLGLTATTNTGGAGAFPAELVGELLGATVRIVIDNDGAGFHRAVTLGSQLAEHGIRAHLYLPDLDDEKVDFTDHIEVGGTVDTLREISLEDARAFVAAFEAAKLTLRVEACLRESVAQLGQTEQSRETSERNAEAWARESATRLEPVTAIDPDLDRDALGEQGRAALDDFRAIALHAARLSRDTFITAGMDVPDPVASAQTTYAPPAPAPADSRPVNRPSTDHSETADASELQQESVLPPRPLAGSGGGGGDRGVFFGNSGDSGDDGPAKQPRIQGDTYDVVDGQTVLVKWAPSGEDGESFTPKYYRVMNGWGELVKVAVEDDGTDSEFARAPHLYEIRYYRYVRNGRGRPTRNGEGKIVTASVTLKYTEDQVRDGSWGNAQPWPGFLQSTSRRGRDQAWDAMMALSQLEQNSVVHSTIGWRTPENGPAYFVHADGGIDADGAIEGIDVDVDKSSEFYRLPAPDLRRDVLRQAWEEGTLSLQNSELPARVVAPLLGHAWTAPLLPSHNVVHLVGGWGSYKTAHSRLAVQYFAPRINKDTKGLISGANSGSTPVALQRVLSAISYVPAIVDDFAPDGDAKGAVRKISSLARTIYNGTGKIRGKQRGGTEADRPVLASVITSGELAAQGSADSRIVNLPMDPSTVKKGGEIFARLETRAARNARGQLGAALIQWIAQRREKLLDSFADAEEDLDHELCTQRYWREMIPLVPGHSGLHDRFVEAAAILDRGIKIMLMMLEDLAVVTAAEADGFHAWARDGILAAINLQESGSSDPAESLMEFLREAIGNGSAHLTSTHGTAPADPESYGWVNQSNGTMPQWRANGARVGAISGDRVWLLPSTTQAVVNRVAREAEEVFADTKVSLASSLLSHGWITTDGQGKRSAVRRIGQVQTRVWDIPLTALLGEGTDPDPDDAGPDPTTDPGPGDLDDDPIDPTPPLFDPQDEDEPTAPEDLDDALSEVVIDEAARQDSDSGTETAPAATSSAPRPQSADDDGEYRAPLGVLHTDGLWLSNGEVFHITRPLEHAGNLAELAQQLRLGTRINRGATGARKTERGQIYLTDEMAISLGIPMDTLPEAIHRDYNDALRDAVKDHPFLTAAEAAGFTLAGDLSRAGTIDIWHPQVWGCGVHLNLLSAQTLKLGTTILTGDPDHATIARRLGKFTAALRFPYRASPGTTGRKLMEALVPSEKHDEIYSPQGRPDRIRDEMQSEQDFFWTRTPTDEETTHRWVHGFDRGGSYLATASVELGIGAPTHRDGPLAFQNKPGYWLITAPPAESWLMPDLFALYGRIRPEDPDQKIWVSTPTLQLADEMGIEVQIHEAWVWERSGKVLESWYRRMRDARTLLDTDDPDDQAARSLLKNSYAAAIGMLNYQGERDSLAVWAPHRHDMIIAKSRANILRRVRANAELTGRWPVAIEKDTIVYTSDSSDPAQAWPGDPAWYGRGLGAYKHEGIDTLDNQLQFLTGDGSYRGKSHLEEVI